MKKVLLICWRCPPVASQLEMETNNFLFNTCFLNGVPDNVKVNRRLAVLKLDLLWILQNRFLAAKYVEYFVAVSMRSWRSISKCRYVNSCNENDFKLEA